MFISEKDRKRKEAFITEYKALCQKYGMKIECQCGWSSYVVATARWLDDQIQELNDGFSIFDPKNGYD